MTTALGDYSLRPIDVKVSFRGCTQRQQPVSKGFFALGAHRKNQLWLFEGRTGPGMVLLDTDEVTQVDFPKGGQFLCISNFRSSESTLKPVEQIRRLLAECYHEGTNPKTLHITVKLGERSPRYSFTIDTDTEYCFETLPSVEDLTALSRTMADSVCSLMKSFFKSVWG